MPSLTSDPWAGTRTCKGEESCEPPATQSVPSYSAIRQAAGDDVLTTTAQAPLAETERLPSTWFAPRARPQSVMGLGATIASVGTVTVCWHGLVDDPATRAGAGAATAAPNRRPACAARAFTMSGRSTRYGGAVVVTPGPAINGRSTKQSDAPSSVIPGAVEVAGGRVWLLAVGRTSGTAVAVAADGVLASGAGSVDVAGRPTPGVADARDAAGVGNGNAVAHDVGVIVAGPGGKVGVPVGKGKVRVMVAVAGGMVNVIVLDGSGGVGVSEGGGTVAVSVADAAATVNVGVADTAPKVIVGVADAAATMNVGVADAAPTVIVGVADAAGRMGVAEASGAVNASVADGEGG